MAPIVIIVARATACSGVGRARVSSRCGAESVVCTCPFCQFGMSMICYGFTLLHFEVKSTAASKYDAPSPRYIDHDQPHKHQQTKIELTG